MARKYRRYIVPAILTVLILIIGFFIITSRVIVMPDALVARFAPWSSPVTADWNGAGNLVGHFGDGDPVERHRGWTRGLLPPAGPFGTRRCTLVYLPPGYDPDRPAAYPVIYALHGFGNRPDIWVETLLPVVEEGIADGTMPPVVVVMPDFSLSGNGEKEGSWPGDGRAGSWYIDSNTGSFRQYFFRTLRTWLEQGYHIRRDPAGTALLGTSMGGFGALYYSISEDSFANIVAALYPKSDLRYSVSGSRLAAFDPDRYAPVVRDRPRRAMMALDGIGLFGVAEDFFIGQAFGTEGPLWPESMPVWERMKSVNPVDLLREESRDLSSVSYNITSGGADEFNFHSQMPLILPELERHGAEVTGRILPELDHGWWNKGYEAERREVVRWIGARLREAGN